VGACQSLTHLPLACHAKGGQEPSTPCSDEAAPPHLRELGQADADRLVVVALVGIRQLAQRWGELKWNRLHVAVLLVHAALAGFWRSAGNSRCSCFVWQKPTDSAAPAGSVWRRCVGCCGSCHAGACCLHGVCAAWPAACACSSPLVPPLAASHAMHLPNAWNQGQGCETRSMHPPPMRPHAFPSSLRMLTHANSHMHACHPPRTITCTTHR
jgi:hypothetical protein